MIPDIVRAAYSEYLDHLNDGGKRIELPQHVHDPSRSSGKIHPSSIGRCPLNAAKSRQTKVNHSLSTKHLMQQGVRDAEPLQEAMLYAYPIEVQPEFTVERAPFRGRFDILYNESIIEIKRRDGYKDKTGLEHSPTPYITDVYQMICYSYMTGYEDIWLCLMTRYNLYFYALTSTIGGFLLIDEHGERWKSQYNNPSYLNYDVVLAEAAIHQQYLNGERDDDPIPFFLNYKGYQCGHYLDNDKPKKYKNTYNDKTQKNALFVPTCPFFKECKGIELRPDGMIEVEETEYASRAYALIPRPTSV